jgi:hypothetical protein
MLIIVRWKDIDVFQYYYYDLEAKVFRGAIAANPSQISHRDHNCPDICLVQNLGLSNLFAVTFRTHPFIGVEQFNDLARKWISLAAAERHIGPHVGISQNISRDDLSGTG